MTDSFLGFGRRMPDYAVPVLNERAVRAGAGILFFLTMVSFMNAWLLGNFAPSLVLGQWMVRKQQPEWTGAPQKRFAWAIGFVLALAVVMFFAAPVLVTTGQGSSHAAPVGQPAPVVQPAADDAAAAAEAERCKVPDFAKAIGHEEMWKRHNNCQ